METTNLYNYSFENALRGKTPHEVPELSEGYRNSDNSYIFPKGFKGDFNSALKKENLFRRYGTDMYVKYGQQEIHAVLSTAKADIVPEGRAYPQDSDDFSQMPFKAYKIATLCKVSEVLMLDKKFNIQKYLTNEFARRFGRAEEKYFINGKGKDQPTGILSAAEIGVETTEITYDDVIKLFFSLKFEYRKNAVWVMNDETAFKLRTLKSSTGDYLWNHNSDTILGRPVEISMYMPNDENGNKPIFFGDLSFYWILQRDKLAVKTLTEKFALQGAIGYAAMERLDGKLIRSEAVKTLKITA